MEVIATLDKNNTYFIDDLGLTTRESVLSCMKEINPFSVDMNIKNKTLFGNQFYTEDSRQVVIYANLAKYGALLFDVEVYLTKINQQLQYRIDVLIGDRLPEVFYKLKQVTEYYEKIINDIGNSLVVCIHGRIPSKTYANRVLAVKLDGADEIE